MDGMLARQLVGDEKIVAAVTYRDFILVFTDRGNVFCICFDNLTQQFTVRRV